MTCTFPPDALRAASTITLKKRGENIAVRVRVLFFLYQKNVGFWQINVLKDFVSLMIKVIHFSYNIYFWFLYTS